MSTIFTPLALLAILDVKVARLCALALGVHIVGTLGVVLGARRRD